MAGIGGGLATDDPLDRDGNNRAVNDPLPDTGIALAGQVMDTGALTASITLRRIPRSMARSIHA